MSSNRYLLKTYTRHSFFWLGIGTSIKRNEIKLKDSKPTLSVKWCEYVRFLYNMPFLFIFFTRYPVQKMYIFLNLSTCASFFI